MTLISDSLQIRLQERIPIVYKYFISCFQLSRLCKTSYINVSILKFILDGEKNLMIIFNCRFKYNLYKLLKLKK